MGLECHSLRKTEFNTTRESETELTGRIMLTSPPSKPIEGYLRISYIYKAEINVKSQLLFLLTQIPNSGPVFRHSISSPE